MRVLLVDDSEDTTYMLAVLLGRMGFEIRTAHGAATALVIAAEFLPDAVCLDIRMPRTNGYDLAIALRALPGLQDVGIVALSGYVADPVREKLAGIDAYFLKPVDHNLIATALMDAVLTRVTARE